MDFLVLCSRAPGNELVAAECETLTGGRPDLGGLAICERADRVSQAAYLSRGMRRVAYGSTLQALTSEVERQSLYADKFQLEYVRLSEQDKIHSREAIRIIADSIRGKPDLDDPQRRFLIIAHDNGYYLGEILAVPDRSFLKHNTKPYRTSSSLPSQLARGVVNLTYPARTILDPCCGTGSLLLEACATGVTVFGIDWNPKIVGMTRQNLLYFGYQAVVEQVDASQCTLTADAVVTDLPYGRFLISDEANLRAILQQMPKLAPFGIFLSDHDISLWLHDVGYSKIEVFRVPKRATMTRYVHRAWIK